MTSKLTRAARTATIVLVNPRGGAGRSTVAEGLTTAFDDSPGDRARRIVVLDPPTADLRLMASAIARSDLVVYVSYPGGEGAAQLVKAHFLLERLGCTGARTPVVVINHPVLGERRRSGITPVARVARTVGWTVLPAAIPYMPTPRDLERGGRALGAVARALVGLLTA